MTDALLQKNELQFRLQHILTMNLFLSWLRTQSFTYFIKGKPPSTVKTKLRKAPTIFLIDASIKKISVKLIQIISTVFWSGLFVIWNESDYNL